MASPTNSSQNGGIVGVSNTFTPATCAAAKVTSFTASGTFTAAATANVDYLVVAGGGGGGGSLGGGGVLEVIEPLDVLHQVQLEEVQFQ